MIVLRKILRKILRKLMKVRNGKFFFVGVILVVGLWFMWEDDPAKVVEEYVKTGDYEGAFEEVERMIEAKKDKRYGLKLKGKLYLLMSLKEWEGGRSQLENSIEVFEKYLVEGRDETNRIREGNVEDYEVYFYLSYGYFLLGKEHYKKSLVYLVQSIKLRDIELWDEDWLGIILKEGHFWVKFMGESYEISVDGWAGYMAYQIGDYERGLGFFKRGFEVSEERVGIYYMYMGLCYMRLGLYNEAIWSIEKFIEIEDNRQMEGVGHLLLSRIDLERRNYEGALRGIELARVLNESVEVWYQYGLIYEGVGEIKKAIKYWKKVIEKDEKHGKAMSKLIRYGQKDEYNQKYNRY